MNLKKTNNIILSNYLYTKSLLLRFLLSLSLLKIIFSIYLSNFSYFPNVEISIFDFTLFLSSVPVIYKVKRYYSSIPTKENKITKTSSVHLLDIAKAFYLDHPTLKYDIKEQIFYVYDQKEQIWQQFSEEQIRLLLLYWLKNNEKFPNILKKIQPNKYADLLSYLKDSSTLFSSSESYLEGGFAALKKNLFCMQDKKEEVKFSESGVLIPFNNGVLIKSHVNGTDLKLFKAHNINFYTSYKLNVEYQPDAVIENTLFEEYLNSLTGNNPNKLNILRACLHCIITNNTSNQLGLYFYGPGGTGKSTLMNILQYILGSDGAYCTSLKSLNSQFGLTNLINKLLVIINDTPYFRGIEPPVLKQIISGDPMEIDIKYQKPVEIVPKAWVIIVSNTLWDLKNPTSGIGRRMVYFNFDNIPNEKIPNLFNLKTNNEMKENLLLPFLPGFINWVLDCPEEYLNQLMLGGDQISEILSPEVIKINPLSKWVDEWLISEENSCVKIGIDTTVASTLLGNYNIWAQLENMDAIGKLRFSDMLLDTLISKKWPNVHKKRTYSGNYIVGVKLREEPLIKEIN